MSLTCEPANRPFLAAAILLLVTAVVSPSLACSPPIGGYRPPTLEYKMMESDVVAYGIVKKLTPDSAFPGDSVFTADFEVRCIFKGAPLKEMIRISQVGTVPGLCISTEMAVNETLLVYLSRYGQEFQPSYRQDPGDFQYLEEVVVLCEATVSYPIGYGPDNNKETCPDEYEYDDCVAIPEPTTAAPPPEVTPKEGTEVVVPPVDNEEVPPPPPNVDEPNPPADGAEEEEQEGQEPPYNPVSADEGPNNGAKTLTLHLGALLCLLLSALAL